MKISNGWIDNSYSLCNCLKIAIGNAYLPINQLEVHTRDLVHNSNYDFGVFLIAVFDAFSFVVGTPHIFDSVELTDLSPELHTAGFSPRTIFE
jgi:hypothetical protein